ncbi:MAG: DUF2807 domain-containing protein [Sphingomonas sp.]
MKTIALFLLPAAALTVAATRDLGPGIPGMRQGNALVYQVDGFDTVALGGPATVDVHVGPGFSVRAEGPAAAFANFRVFREGGTLRLGRRYEDDDGHNDLDRQIVVHVTLPRLNSVSLGGSGAMNIDRVRAERFQASLGGSGTMTLGALDVGQATISIGGSGRVSAAGHAKALETSIGGSGSLAAPALHAESATVSIAGSGSVRAAVDGSAHVTMVGSGGADLGPRSRCSITRIGHGTVRCGR